MSRPAGRGSLAIATAALPPSAGPVLWLALPEPWGALAWFYLFLVFGALTGAARARRGSAGPAAFRFGAAFSIPGAVLPFSLVPADAPGLVISTAAAWGIALGAGAALGAFLSAPRLAGTGGSRFGAAARWGVAFLAGGAAGGAAADLIVTSLPGRWYLAAWAIGLIGGSALAGRLLGPRRAA
jgi:hypothetical protein